MAPCPHHVKKFIEIGCRSPDPKARMKFKARNLEFNSQAFGFQKAMDQLQISSSALGYQKPDLLIKFCLLECAQLVLTMDVRSKTSLTRQCNIR